MRLWYADPVFRRLPFAVLVLGFACGGPQKLDADAARATTPEQLCDRYVSLEAKAFKLEGDRLAYKREKCLPYAKSWKNDDAFWVCMVQCTYEAADHAAARGCRGRCGAAPPGSVLPP